MARVQYLILGLILLVTFACSGTNSGPAAEETAGTAVEEAAGETPQTEAPQAETPKKASAPPRNEAPPQPPQPKYSTLAAGTVLPVRILDPIDTSVNKTGDTFRAAVDEDIMVGNSILIPRGSQVEGELTYVERSGRVKGRAAVSLQLVSMQVGSRTYPLKSDILSFEAESTKKKDAAKVGIGSGIGAVVGAIAGGGKGAAIGAAVGAGAGGATVAATRGEELKYDVEHPFEFTLNEDLQVRIR